jgi:hypothetical protein
LSLAGDDSQQPRHPTESQTPTGFGFHPTKTRKVYTLKAPFNTWTHPASGELRVYCNTPYPGIKIWMERLPEAGYAGPIDFDSIADFAKSKRCRA